VSAVLTDDVLAAWVCLLKVEGFGEFFENLWMLYRTAESGSYVLKVTGRQEGTRLSPPSRHVSDAEAIEWIRDSLESLRAHFRIVELLRENLSLVEFAKRIEAASGGVMRQAGAGRQLPLPLHGEV